MCECVCDCASVRVCECASVRVCECVSVRVCECVCVSEDMPPCCSAQDKKWLIMKLCMYVAYHTANNVSHFGGGPVTQFNF